MSVHVNVAVNVNVTLPRTWRLRDPHRHRQPRPEGSCHNHPPGSGCQLHIRRDLTKHQLRGEASNDRWLGIEETDTEKDLPCAVARKLLSFILTNGEVLFSRHALQELARDGMTQQDALNVLRVGRIFEPGELVSETWRYRCHTDTTCVVIAFDSATRTVVVTAWRKK